jgi:hypothetical protein
MSLWLTPEELETLTGYRRRGLQRRALAELGVKFRSRPADGFPLVDRSQFDAKPMKRREPDFDAARTA